VTKYTWSIAEIQAEERAVGIPKNTVGDADQDEGSKQCHNANEQLAIRSAGRHTETTG